MAILKRINKYQGLKDIDVLKEESGLSSKYFNIYDVPTNIPQGRSSFLLAGSPFLKNFVELKVEILDSAGQTVYTEPVANYLEGNARRISVEVYDDTAPGDGFLYIVGELKDNFRNVSGQQQQNIEITDNFLTPEDRADFIEHSNDVPSEFQDVYNVRYIRPIFINTVIPNSEPIFFYQQPRITINEILKGYVVETTVSSSYEITGSVSVDPLPDLPSKDPEPDPIDGFSKGMIDGARDEVGAQLEIFKNRRKSKIDPLRNNKFAKSGRITRRASPEIDRFTITVDQLETSPENTTSDAVTSAFIGGEITIKSPKVDTTKYPTDEYTIPTEYKSSIKKVNNEKTLVPLDDFVITKKDTGEKVPVKIEQGGEGEPSDMEVTMSVVPTPPQVISTTHYRSYADIVVGNLHTFSGDVYKAKIYAKSKGTLGDFEPVYDASIESPQVLIDAFSATGFKNTGYFYTQSIVDNYWVTSSNSTATQDNSQFIDGVLISGSNAGYTPKNSTVNTVEFNTSHSYNLEKSVPYTIEFNAYYYKENKQGEYGNPIKQAELEVYLSGSAITGGTEEDYKLGKVTVSDDANEGEVLGVHNTFTSAGSGSPNTHLKFKATSGRWIIQDILLRPHSETNFNPSYFRTVVPMDHPLPKKPDQYDFLVEFYDLNNNIAETISIKENVTFAGAPVNIEGDGNLLSGSLYLGGTESSGIEVHGGSAYLRSIGYDGFDKTIASGSGGFLIWSGSVGARLSASENYDGVGLEIVDAHSSTDKFLQFKTNPSTFKVQTDEFFLGSSTQFVSGSSGNIEISSSNFHLTADGDVTMSGTISATAGNIGNFQIIDGKISGSNITMDATNSTIYKTDQGPGSDSGESFAQLKDEYYIDFTPEEESPDNYYIKMGPMFGVDKDGILFASGAKFEGSITASQGLIGGFTTDSHSFYSSNIFISGSPAAGGINQDKYMFISTSNWNVKQDGQQTGSEVLFTGGTIGGFTLSSTALTGGSTTQSVALTPGTGIHMGHATFGSAPFSVTNAGVIKAESGTIGGFTLSATQLSATNFVINAPNKSITLGTSDDVIIIDADVGIQVGDATFNDAEFSVDIRGNLRAVSGSIAGWEIDSNKIFKDNIQLQSNNSIISIGGTTFGSAGVQLQYDSQGKFYAGDGSNNRIQFDSSGVDIKTTKFELDTPTIDISTTNRRFQVFGTGSNAGKEYIRLGEISTDSSDKYGLKVYSGEGTGSAELIAMFGEIGNKIAGWEFTNTQMRSIPVAGLGGVYDFDAGEDGIIIQSNVTESRIETAGFVSGLKGFRMSSLGNGSAEFENMRIRGTLRTTVFEKESVNVVGGQLMVANSTTIQALKSGSVILAGSSSVSATDVTMSVANASGFSRGEILKVKGVDDTGFSVEYLYVTGSKRFSEDASLAHLTGSEDTGSNAPPLDPDGIAGELYVGRGYGGTGPSQISSSISVLSAGISLNEGGGEPEFGTIDTISVDSTGSLAIQDILKIDEEKMKITAISGSGTAASASLTVVRDFQDTIPSIHNAGTTVYKFNPDMQFLAGLVSSARPYQEGQVLVSTGKYASGTGYHDKFSYNANVSDTPNANGEYRILSGSTHITTNVTGSTHLEIYKIDKDAVDHNSLFSLFDKSSYIIILIDGTAEWVRFRVSGNPTVAGNVHTYPISLNQDFYQVQTPATDTTSDDVDFWFLSNIQDVSSGYIMMNANPNDPYSPYMDFVERTGPDVYDLQLRTRLGDLSGLSSAYLYGEEEPGFGLYTENGFFKGTLHAMTGSIHGILNVATQQGGIETGQKITIGRGVDGTHDGFRINNNNYWFTTGEFRLGDATNYLHVSGTEANIASNISIKTDDLNIDTTNFDVSTDNGGSIALGSLTNVNPNTTNKGFYVSGSGETLIKGGTDANDDYLLFNTTNGVQLRTQDVSIVTTGTNKLKIDSTSTPVIAMGATLPTAYDSGTGFFVDGTGKLLLGSHNGNRIQWDGSNVTLVGTIRQSLSGQTYTDFINRGTWAHTTIYASGSDLVTYNNGTNTSTYLCKNSHTSSNDSDTTTGNPASATNSWNVYAEGSTGSSGAPGAPGSNAKTVVVTPDSYFFVKSQAGTYSPSSITVSGSTQNTTADGAWSTTAGTLSDSVNTHTNASTKVTSGNFADGMVVTYTLHGDDGSIKDSVTLKELDEGSGTVQALLSNQSHTFQANNSGTVSDFSGGGTTIKCYEGATELTFESTAGDVSAGEFSASIDSVTGGITAGAFTGDGTSTAVLAPPSAMTNESGSIHMTITGSTLNDTDFEFPLSQSFAKSLAGSDGTSAANLSVAASSQVMALDDSNDTSLSPTTVTITATQANQASNLIDGDLSVDNSAAKSAFSYSAGSGTGTGTATWTVTPNGYASGDFPIVCTVTNDSLSDSITIHRIVGGDTGAAGADAYTVIVSNESHVIPQGSSQGLAARTYTNSGTNIIAYKGTTELNSTTSTPGAGEFKVTATGTNITPSTGTVTGNPFVFPDHSGMNSDNASIGYSVNLENSATFPKSQSFTTSQAAGSGSDGASVTGPAGAGTVFRGDWDASKTYTNTSIRRDIVDYSAVNASNPYWICLHDGATGAGENPPTSGTLSNTYWETFGATFSSVATDILLAQNATITQGLVIGQDGSNEGFIRSTSAVDSGSGTGFFFHEDGTSWLGNRGGSYLGISSSGTVTAAGFKITTDYLTSNSSKDTYNSSNTGVFLGTAGIGLGTGEFHVSSAGYLTATSGLIGNWTIGSTLSATNILLDPGTPKITIGGKTSLTSADTGVWLSTDGIALGSSSPFKVTHEGVLTAKSGTVGGWTLGLYTLTGDQVELDMNNNNGRIRMGSSLPNSATDGTGFYADGDGTFLVGSSGGNRIQYTSNGNIVLQSNTFALNTNTMILDSGVNSGKISLGASGGPTSVDPNTTRRGIYMDGTGDILIKASGSANDAYMKFTTAGLELKTANLEFDTSGNIISKEYLIERSRLFGSGVDATIVLSDNSNSGCTFQDSDYAVNNVNSTRILLNGPERASQGATYGTGTENWHQLGDIYCENFTINSGVHLWTNGYRIFVRDTFTNNGTIRNDGFDAGDGSSASTTGGTAGKGAGSGTGAPGGTLAPGVNGALGGGGGASGGGTGQSGGAGGGGGGSGGTVLIFARILAGSGDVVTTGGRGGNGGDAQEFFN